MSKYLNWNLFYILNSNYILSIKTYWEENPQPGFNMVSYYEV